MFLKEGIIFPSPSDTVLPSVTTQSHYTRLKFHQVAYSCSLNTSKLKNIHLVQIWGSFWQPGSCPRPQFRWQQLFCPLWNSSLDLPWCTPSIQTSVAVLSHKTQLTSAQSPTNLQERRCIYTNISLLSIEGTVTNWPKVIAAMFCVQPAHFQASLKNSLWPTTVRTFLHVKLCLTLFF